MLLEILELAIELFLCYFEFISSIVITQTKTLLNRFSNFCSGHQRVKTVQVFLFMEFCGHTRWRQVFLTFSRGQGSWQPRSVMVLWAPMVPSYEERTSVTMATWLKKDCWQNPSCTTMEKIDTLSGFLKTV